MRILVDMDGVLADFDSRIDKTYKTCYPTAQHSSQENRTTIYYDDLVPLEHVPIIESLCQRPGFIRGLEPILGGKQALDSMVRMGHTVFICTSPLTFYENNVLEKYQWVDDHLGKAPSGSDWTRRIILTKDKTVIDADILIDDKPYITGVSNPTWEHILFDQPYNRHVKDKRRLSWDNWKEILLLQCMEGVR